MSPHAAPPDVIVFANRFTAKFTCIKNKSIKRSKRRDVLNAYYILSLLSEARRVRGANGDANDERKI